MERILVGLDASPRAKVVLAAALGLAKKTGAKLVLFRAVGLPPTVPDAAWSLAPCDVGDMLAKEANDYLEACAREVPPECLGGLRTDVGTPWQTICSVAKEERAELIVIGSHAYTTADRFLGTTAAKVVNHAESSVLVVRTDHLLDEEVASTETPAAIPAMAAGY